MKITHHDAPETPSQQLVSQGTAEQSITDSRGRVLVARKPSVLTRFRFVEMLGTSASNETYFGMCFPLLFLVSIDGETVRTPTSKIQLEALIQRLDDDGLNALTGLVLTHFNPDPEADREALKK